MDILGIKPEVWFPVVTLVAGAVLKAFFDSRSDKRRHAAEKAARDEARADALAIRSYEFQREALLELQDAAQVLIRGAGKSHYEDLRAAHAGKPWGTNLLSREANDKSHDGHTRLTRFRVRVEDQQIRDVADELSAACARRSVLRSEDEAEEVLQSATALFLKLNEMIGAALRTTGGR